MQIVLQIFIHRGRLPPMLNSFKNMDSRPTPSRGQALRGHDMKKDFSDTRQNLN